MQAENCFMIISLKIHKYLIDFHKYFIQCGQRINPCQQDTKSHAELLNTQSHANVPDQLNTDDGVGLPVDVGQRNWEGVVAELGLLRIRF